MDMMLETRVEIELDPKPVEIELEEPGTCNEHVAGATGNEHVASTSPEQTSARGDPEEDPMSPGQQPSDLLSSTESLEQMLVTSMSGELQIPQSLRKFRGVDEELRQVAARWNEFCNSRLLFRVDNMLCISNLLMNGLLLLALGLTIGAYFAVEQLGLETTIIAFGGPVLLVFLLVVWLSKVIPRRNMIEFQKLADSFRKVLEPAGVTVELDVTKFGSTAVLHFTIPPFKLEQTSARIFQYGVDEDDRTRTSSHMESTRTIGRVLEDEQGGSAENGGNVECAVCLCELVLGEECAALPCGHVFHACCVGEWLQSNVCCPLCRENIWLPRESPTTPTTGSAESLEV